MTTQLCIPPVSPDADTVSAAIAYAEAGWFVLPVLRGSKHPGSVVGDGWQYQSTQDPKMIAAWLAGTDHGIALHAGRSGAVVFDVDDPTLLPSLLRDAVSVLGVPFQSTRTNAHGRGHYVFRQPDGRMIGNSTGMLGGGWGEVRGLNGVIIVAPSAHEKTPEGGRYAWQCAGPVPKLPANLAAALPDATAAEKPVTDVEVKAFLAEHNRNDHPGLLSQVSAKFTEKVNVGGSRHDAARDQFSLALKEAHAGYYPASVAVERLGELFDNAIRAETGRHRADEWPGLLKWAVAVARVDDAVTRRDATENRLAEQSPRMTAINMNGGQVETRKEETLPTAAPVPTAPVTKKEETSAPPVADPAMFRGILGEITRAAEPTTEADPVGILVSLLAFASVAIGAVPHVQIGNTRHPLLIWPLLFGRTGSGRKGEASHTGQRFHAEADPQSVGYAVTGLSSGEGLIERVRDVRDENDEGGTEDKRLLVTEPEFSSVMARSKREGNTLASVLRQAWDGQALSVLNRSALHASSSHIAIIGHITPAEFRLRLAETEMAGGTYNRFLPVYVERSRRLPLPTGIPSITVTMLGTDLHDRITNATFIDGVTLDRDAEKLWCEQLYDELTEADEEDAAWTEFARRAAPYCLRIAALHAVLDGNKQVSTEDLAAAAALVRYSIASAKYVLDRMHRDPRVERIRRELDQAGNTGLARTEVSALFSRNLAATALDQLLTELLASEHYETYNRATGGRPALCYRRVAGESSPG